VIITGASAGIGRETALAFATEKAHVVLAARRKERLDEVAAAIRTGGGTALAIPTDVGNEAEVNHLISTVVEQFGRIDILLNNAGAGLYAKVEETSPDQMERIWRINFLGTYYAIRAALPVLLRQKAGHIITVSSMAGKRATPLNAAYCATKFAQAGLMESLRMELRNTGIHCTVVFPGATETEFLSVQENPGNRNVRHHFPVQSPARVAQAIVKVARSPRPEVLVQKFGKTLVILNALSPSFVDWVVSNTVKRKLVM
jgi:short-subunit dehydrogenase